MTSLAASVSAASASRDLVGAAAQRPGERVAVPPVLVAIQRQHARANDTGGREPRIVDREGARVAQHGLGQISARHQPAAQRRQPRDRLGLAQAPQRGVGIRGQLGDGDVGAERELRAARSCIGFGQLGLGHSADANTRAN